MRVTALALGSALVLAACGGKKDGSPDTAGYNVTPPPAGTTAAGTGASHEVQMVQDGSTYKFVPAELTIKPGETVVFKSVSGVTHNVAFWGDSIPPGSKEKLDAAITDKMGELMTNFVPEGSQTSITFPADLPTGVYNYYCQPHLAFGMRAKITIAQ